MSKKSKNNSAKPESEEIVEEKAGEGLEEKIAELLKENEELKASVAKEKDDYLRLMADFENFRRHSA